MLTLSMLFVSSFLPAPAPAATACCAPVQEKVSCCCGASCGCESCSCGSSCSDCCGAGACCAESKAE